MNIITDATAHGLSSDKDKCILNFLFFKIFFKFFRETPFIISFGAPNKLFLTSTSLNFNLFPIETALKSASFAANLFAKQLVFFFYFFTFYNFFFIKQFF